MVLYRRKQLLFPVMWSETVLQGLGLFMVLEVWCCETWSCYARHHNDVEGHSSFSSTILVSLFCAWKSLLLRSTVAFTYLKVKSAKCL